jgi:hypothetical protein
MSACLLLDRAVKDTVGAETCVRVVGGRERPGRMSIQVGVTGTANVQIQGRIVRDAPWLNLGPAYTESALAYIEPVPFLRAVASNMAAGACVSAWAIWAW